ncbi:MAG: hypothetical protein ACRYG7_19270 [Janthinobacterium lividum]
MERYEATELARKYFNLIWVRLHVNGLNTLRDLLLSSTDSDTQLAHLTQPNELLYEELRTRLLAPQGSFGRSSALPAPRLPADCPLSRGPAKLTT